MFLLPMLNSHWPWSQPSFENVTYVALDMECITIVNGMPCILCYNVAVVGFFFFHIVDLLLCDRIDYYHSVVFMLTYHIY